MPSILLVGGEHAKILAAEALVRGFSPIVTPDTSAAERLLCAASINFSAVVSWCEDRPQALARLVFSVFPMSSFVFAYSDNSKAHVFRVLAAGGMAIPAPISWEDVARPCRMTEAHQAFRVAATYASVHKLSRRQCQVLLCALGGDSRDQAAARIGCSVATVATHWKRICEATKRVSQADVLLDVFRFALRHGDAANVDTVRSARNPVAEAKRKPPTG